MADAKKPLKVSIKSYGCQMNVYDSEVAGGLLEKAGFEIIDQMEPYDRPDEASPATSHQSPDVILMNTCSVREHAEERVYGRLGMIGKAKRSNPNLIVGLMGCMVEEHKEKLFQRFPHLDLMVGTRNIKELPALIEDVRKNRTQVAKIKQDGISIEYTESIKRLGKYHAWLPIMTGCNKVCTFCIVPITRGSEVSMPARDVYREASRLVGEGVKWITLLGQNVNSYKGTQEHRSTGTQVQSNHPDLCTCDLCACAPSSSFPELLEMLCQISGLERISFTTSHPHDATEELYRVIARNPKISRRFHLPLQSGSDKILKRMKRLHTYAEYKTKIDRMRELIPDVSITTDIIAGFPGETDEDHKATVRALEEIRYDDAYIYKYSVRSATPAANLPDDVPFSVKEARNAELLEIQRGIRDENNRVCVGETVEVFVEGVSPKNKSEVRGRTHQERKVVFEGPRKLIGSFQKVTIIGLKNETFVGEQISGDIVIASEAKQSQVGLLRHV